MTNPRMRVLAVAACVAGAMAAPVPCAAQAPPHLVAERRDFAEWLRTSPASPYAAIYHQPFTDELVFGPGGDPVLAHLPSARLEQGRARLALIVADRERTVPRNRDVPLGDWRVRVTGPRGRARVTVFGPFEEAEPPGWFPFAAEWVIEGVLEPPGERETRLMLGLDGVEIEATRAGTFVAREGDVSLRLVVYRMPEPGTEESELNIFFRDATNAQGTYPAGRFLALRPLGGNRYLADFNRARNPFCGYNGLFPCPRPWPGNALDVAVEAGELYAGSETEARW